MGLSAEPKGRVVSVTADGEGGEKVGDILRFTLEWQGQTAPVPQMFDVCSCMEQRLGTSFDRVVKALTSNDGTYANEIVLIFERPLSGASLDSINGVVVQAGSFHALRGRWVAF